MEILGRSAKLYVCDIPHVNLSAAVGAKGFDDAFGDGVLLKTDEDGFVVDADLDFLDASGGATHRRLAQRARRVGDT